MIVACPDDLTHMDRIRCSIGDILQPDLAPQPITHSGEMVGVQRVSMIIILTRNVFKCEGEKRLATRILRWSSLGTERAGIARIIRNAPASPRPANAIMAVGRANGVGQLDISQRRSVG